MVPIARKGSNGSLSLFYTSLSTHYSQIQDKGECFQFILVKPRRLQKGHLMCTPNVCIEIG